MSEPETSPTPWRAGPGSDADPGRWAFSAEGVHLFFPATTSKPGDLSRLVACVNALAGVPLGAIESGAVRDRLEEVGLCPAGGDA